MKECAFHETLTMAETACANAIKNCLPEDMPMFRFENPGRTDCAGFNIGSPRTGDRPESGCISEIMRETVATHAGEVATCSVSIAFDVVFAVRFD